MKRVLITGANRGIGFEFVRQLSLQNYQVLACYRDLEHAEILETLSKFNSNIQLLRLDVSNDINIQMLSKELANLPIDWLINNAGIQGEHGVTVGNIDQNNFFKVMEVNCFGVLKISEVLLPNLQKGKDKLIVALTSSLTSMTASRQGRNYAYKSSKAALNCAMRSFALDTMNMGMKVMLINPGWVKTRIGGLNAPLDAHTSVTGMLKVIEKYRENSHAEVMRSYDDSIIPW
jgi:NAD(P)-dependent dehydrogenase (short-subunit alcohol dehydrogenase family)